MMKRLIIPLFVAIISTTSSFAIDKITTVCIVNMDKVYKAFESQADGMKAFNDKKAEFQAELKVLTQELTTLQAQKLALPKTDQAESVKIDQKILEKAKFIRDLKAVREQELENIRQGVERNDKFKQALDEAINYISVSQGFSIVMLAGADSPVYFYVPDVDITRKVIDYLKKTFK